MAAEVSADLTLIQDEDVLRRMWAETEDFGRKKEIRARMYKLREQRLKDFYTSGEVVTEITGRKHAATTHTESIGDQGFLTMKTKEIRDSESPTRDFNRRGNNGYWTSVEERDYSSGNQGGIAIERKEESRKGEGVVFEGNTETRMALSNQNIQEKSTMATDNTSMTSEKLDQNQVYVSSSVTDTGDSSMRSESQEKHSSQATKEEKITQNSSQSKTFSSTTSSSSSSKRIVSSSQSYKVISGGDEEILKDADVRAITSGGGNYDIQSRLHSGEHVIEEDSNTRARHLLDSSTNQANTSYRTSEEIVYTDDYDGSKYDQSRNVDQRKSETTKVQSHQTNENTRKNYSTKETSYVITKENDQRDTNSVYNDNQRRTIISTSIDDVNLRDSTVNVDQNIHNETLRQKEEYIISDQKHKYVADSNEFLSNERTDNSRIIDENINRTTKTPYNRRPEQEDTGRDTEPLHSEIKTEVIVDSSQVRNESRSNTNQKILTEIHNLDTYLQNQSTPAPSEPVSPKSVADSTNWTVVSNQGGEFIYQDDKTLRDHVDTHRIDSSQPREPLIKHPSSLDLPKEPSEGQYVTTYQQSYNRISVDNSPSHEFFAKTLRASPDRLTPSPTKSSRGSLDRNSPERRLRAASKGSLDRSSPETSKKRSFSKGSLDRSSPDRPTKSFQPKTPDKERRGSGESYTIERRRDSRRKTTEITQSTLKESAKPKRKFSSTQQKAANKNRISTPGVSPSTSPTRSGRPKEATSGSESDISQATYNKTTSVSSIHNERNISTKQDTTKDIHQDEVIKTRVTDSKIKRGREKSPEYSSEGSITKELKNVTKLQPKEPEGSAFKPIKHTVDKTSTIDSSDKFIIEEKNYTVQEVEEKDSTDTKTGQKIRTVDGDQSCTITEVNDFTEEVISRDSPLKTISNKEIKHETSTMLKKYEETDSTKLQQLTIERTANDNYQADKDTKTTKTSPSANRDHSPNKDTGGIRKQSRPERKEYSPNRQESSPNVKESSPKRKESSPSRKTSKSDTKETNPERKVASPNKKESSPLRRETSPIKKEYTPSRKESLPSSKEPSPSRKESTPSRKEYSPSRKDSGPSQKEIIPSRKESSPTRKTSSPSRKESSPTRKTSSPTRKESSPSRKESSPTRKTSSLSRNDSIKNRNSKTSTPRTPSPRSSPDRSTNELPSRDTKKTPTHSPSVSPERYPSEHETKTERKGSPDVSRRSESSSPSPDRRRAKDYKSLDNEKHVSSNRFINAERTYTSRTTDRRDQSSSNPEYPGNRRIPSKTETRDTSESIGRTPVEKRPSSKSSPRSNEIPQRKDKNISPRAESKPSTPRQDFPQAKRKFPEPKREISPTKGSPRAYDSVTVSTTQRTTRTVSGIKQPNKISREPSITRRNTQMSPKATKDVVESTTTITTITSKTSPNYKKTPVSKQPFPTKQRLPNKPDDKNSHSAPSSPTKTGPVRKPTDTAPKTSGRTQIPKSLPSKLHDTSTLSNTQKANSFQKNVVQSKIQNRIPVETPTGKRPSTKTSQIIIDEDHSDDVYEDEKILSTKKFISSERTDIFELEDENPPEEFYAEYDDRTDEGSPERQKPSIREEKPDSKLASPKKLNGPNTVTRPDVGRPEKQQKPLSKDEKPIPKLAHPKKSEPSNISKVPKQKLPQPTINTAQSVRTEVDHKTTKDRTTTKKVTKRTRNERELSKEVDTSSPSSSEDEEILIDETDRCISREFDEIDHENLVSSQDHLKVIIQHPKSSRESSPGYPSTGVPFCTTSDDGESNPRYADFVSEPEDVEVFDKRQGPPMPIRLTDEPDSPCIPSVADRVNVFLETTKTSHEKVHSKEVTTDSPKSVLKAKTMFENIAKNQATNINKTTEVTTKSVSDKPQKRPSHSQVRTPETHTIYDTIDVNEQLERDEVSSSRIVQEETKIVTSLTEPETPERPLEQPGGLLKGKPNEPDNLDVQEKRKPSGVDFSSKTDVFETKVLNENIEKHRAESFDTKKLIEQEIISQHITNENIKERYRSPSPYSDQEDAVYEKEHRDSTRTAKEEIRSERSDYEKITNEKTSVTELQNKQKKAVADSHQELHTKTESLPKRKPSTESPSPQRQTTKPKPREQTEGKKLFERVPSGPTVDVSSKKNFFERKAQDVSQSVTRTSIRRKEPISQKQTPLESHYPSDKIKVRQGEEDEVNRVEVKEASYMKSTLSSSVKTHSPERNVQSPTSHRPETYEENFDDAPKKPETPIRKPYSSETVSRPKPEEIIKKPSKPEEIFRKPSRTDEISRKLSKPEELVRKPSRQEDIQRKHSKPDETYKKPSKPEEIVRKSSKTDEIVRKFSKTEDSSKKSFASDETTRTTKKADEIAKKASKFETSPINKKTFRNNERAVEEDIHRNIVSERIYREEHVDERTDELRSDSYIKSTTSNSVRSISPEKQLDDHVKSHRLEETPKKTTRSQETPYKPLKTTDLPEKRPDSRTESSYMRSTISTTRRSETPDYEEAKRKPSGIDSRSVRSQETKRTSKHDDELRTKQSITDGYDNSEVTLETKIESYVRNNQRDFSRESSPDKHSRTATPDNDSIIVRRRDDKTYTTVTSGAAFETTSTKTTQQRSEERNTVGKFGVTLRKTPSATKMVSKPTTPRQHSRPTDTVDIESIFDVELLEEMLLKAVGYDDRRQIRAQIRLVKKQIEEEKNSSVQVKTTRVISTVQSSLPSVKDIKRPRSPDKSVSPERPYNSPSYSPERRKIFTSPERKATSPERKVKSPERKVTSPERKLTSPERKYTSPDRKLSSPEQPLRSPTRKQNSPERKISSTERKERSPERKFTSPERKQSSPERSPTRRTSHEKVLSNGVRETRTVYETTTTVRSQNVKKLSSSDIKEPSPTDLITSSYGVGPTDENGRPLFGLQALRRTSTTKTLLDENEEHETVLEEDESSLFGLKALQGETMPAESSQLRELVERHQQYVKESSTKELQPVHKPRAKLRDSFILNKEEDETSITTHSSDSNKGLSLKSIIQKQDTSGTTVRSSMESTSTVIKSHSSISSDGKVSLHRDVIHGEVSSKNGEQPTGKVTKTSYSYQSPKEKESVPSIKSSTTTSVIGGRRSSGPKIEEISDSTTVSDATRRFSKEYTVDEEETVVERRRSSGLSVDENVKRYSSILKNSNQQTSDTGRRQSGPRITDVSDEPEERVVFSKTTKITKDIPDSKTASSDFLKSEVKTDAQKKVVTRGDSVKALQHKFQQATVSSSLKQSSVERTDSKNRVLETKEIRVEESTASPTVRTKISQDRSEVIQTTQVSKSEEPTSFLDNRTKVTGVQDILTRMRNADLVTEHTDTTEDAEARALLNKFLGASVILQGMEQGMRAAHHHSETEDSSTSPASAALVIQAEKQLRVKATSARPVEDDIDDITDEKQLRILLDACSDYEGRRKLRARLRTIMAEQKGTTEDTEESHESTESSEVRKGDTLVKTEVHTRTSSAKLTKANSVQSPFAKFRQLERQNSAPRTYK